MSVLALQFPYPERFMKLLKFYMMIALVLLLLSCDDWFEFSPYDSDINKQHLNLNEASTLEKNKFNSDTLKFAVISDIHDNYDNLSAAISRINLHNDLKFVVCCGDITNSGLLQQFEWFIDIVRKSEVPFFTLIGNHDHRSNGKDIYKEAFGDMNFTFQTDGYEFICFNNTVWENKNRTPEYEWLNGELSNDNNLEHIVICHIPPWHDQMSGNNESLFNTVVTPENTMLCIHGHTHNYEERIYQGIPTLVSDAINDRRYCIVSISGKSVSIKLFSF